MEKPNEVTVIETDAGHFFEVHACGCRDIERNRKRVMLKGGFNDYDVWNEPAGVNLVSILDKAGHNNFANDYGYENTEDYLIAEFGADWKNSFFKIHACAKGRVA